MKINPYLMFSGNCEAAFKFYQQCFGGKIVTMMTHREAPPTEHVPIEWHDKIMHACLDLGDRLLMGSDSPDEHFETPQGFYVQVSIESPEEAERIFHALAENGKVKMPIDQTFWSVRFGMLVDQFGTPWMINCEKVA
ncbi:VOC family protein [Dulcicalothrix desertica PCC 7102]|uniref:VOC family protein n=1 Tax=Dulcicalothrix desertica PCC 7102 TaxID=232991 RepID=A0A433V7Y1_9CYAN|nr:VOC family protein [Dulcicalothrix desertica]RUT02233.1 VOC family protein [Dulcicalothrix desertica PCC 7102]TWH53874.1 PhnB protein [Dulcicalothrix desertica PCC 7102]